MPKAKLHLLSDLQINKLKVADTDQMVSDGGGLYLYVRQYKSKEWIFRYTSPLTNKRRKQSIGSYPDIDLKEARRIAGRKRTILDRGQDPIEIAEEERLLEVEKLKQRQLSQGSLVNDVFENWLKEDLQNRKDKGKETARMFRKDVLPTLGQLPIHEATRQHIKQVLTMPLSRGANRVANKILSDLKQFFGYAEDEELITHNPTRRIFKDRVGGREYSRKRVLEKEELLLLTKQLPLARLKPSHAHVIWLYLATACRRNELLKINLSDINIETRTLYISSERAKNTDAHTIHLSDFAITQIKAIQQSTGNNEWLIPNRAGNAAIDESALTKQIADRQIAPEKTKMVKGRIMNDALLMPNGHWHVHDLRRTAATIMQELGVMPYVIKKCLNQRIDDKIMETYQRAKLVSEQKEAFEKLGNYLSEIYLNEH